MVVLTYARAYKNHLHSTQRFNCYVNKSPQSVDNPEREYFGSMRNRDAINQKLKEVIINERWVLINDDTVLNYQKC